MNDAVAAMPTCCSATMYFLVLIGVDRRQQSLFFC